MSDVTDDFAFLAGSDDPPMVLVTSAVEGQQAGCLVGFHSQSSIDPPRYCVWLSKANRTYRITQRATHFAIHFLTANDLPLAERFGTLTGDVTDKFAGIGLSTHEGGVPVLDDCPHWVVARRMTLLDDGGDHVCVVGEVIEAHAGGAFSPLRLSQVAGLDAGHSVDEPQH
jgi:flavin reductase (DIM6/NTAB) family NADH-FMN oxidoreductase RutF